MPFSLAWARDAGEDADERFFDADPSRNALVETTLSRWRTKPRLVLVRWDASVSALLGYVAVKIFAWVSAITSFYALFDRPTRSLGATLHLPDSVVWLPSLFVAVSIRLWRRSDLAAARIAESAPQHV